MVAAPGVPGVAEDVADGGFEPSVVGVLPFGVAVPLEDVADGVGAPLFAVDFGVVAPHHVFTPPCFEQAPRSVFAVVKVLSEHWPVEFFGALAGFCAKVGAAKASAAAITAAENNRRAV